MPFDNEQKFEYQFYTISYHCNLKRMSCCCALCCYVSLVDKETSKDFTQTLYLHDGFHNNELNEMFILDKLEDARYNVIEDWKAYKNSTEEGKTQLWLHEFLHAVNKVEARR